MRLALNAALPPHLGLLLWVWGGRDACACSGKEAGAHLIRRGVAHAVLGTHGSEQGQAGQQKRGALAHPAGCYVQARRAYSIGLTPSPLTLKILSYAGKGAQLTRYEYEYDSATQPTLLRPLRPIL